ncbi:MULTISPECIES: baseplate assembly protein [Paenibacillus]|uniref:baseplate assembly protein n=1 Tax=Paenibacillus TaxID=44249 RepID=UPI0022B8EBAC|nr:baseplate J/gp47 family protein [Paenibacillus caseinilyticus]MCZ8520118.1 baseplate J/gp47 family protein [Paenibacillus caseinilyticus]
MSGTLFDLPDIQFTDPNVLETANDLITSFEAISDTKLYPADPVRLFFLSIAKRLVVQEAMIDTSAKANLLRYARKDFLDHLGAFSETTRLEATAAVTTMRFNVSQAQASAIPIPSGTRTVPEAKSGLYFEVVSPGSVPAGATHTDLLCRCALPGEAGNGYLPGQINRLVDPIPYISSVSNVTESSGGADRETDDMYRERIHEAPESFSVAGPDGAYKYWAKSASPQIIDVAVHTPSPGVVNIVPLLAGGESPSQELLDAVLAKCSDKKVRPLTDNVTASAPTDVEYSVSYTYWIESSRASEEAAIRQAVEAASEGYTTWQKSKLGRDINPSELIRRAMAAGAYRVDITAPVFQALAKTEKAALTAVNVVYGGLMDD